jgi:competence ComEA-like helix-hairpin-helix protein
MALPTIDAWTPRERRTAATLAAVWIAGALSGWSGLDRSLAAAAERLLHPPRPSVAELAARVGPGDPRPEWYAAALALRAEEELAASGPSTIDPNAASRAAWDRLPGIGPVTAIAIIEHRRARGPFRGPEDLLDVRGIGPRTLEKLRPFLAWEAGRPAAGHSYAIVSKGGVMPGGLPDLNVVDGAFLATLPGFGPELAKTILRERQARGMFRDWTDLVSIDGVGPARLRVLQKATRLRGTTAPGEGD